MLVIKKIVYGDNFEKKHASSRWVIVFIFWGTNWCCFTKLYATSGADLGFSRGVGAGFQKEVENFDDLFFYFRSTQFDFLSSPKALFCPYFGKSFCAAGKFLKKQSKTAFLGTFWKILTKKLLFFGARSPLKISKYWRQGAFRKFLGSVGQKWIS